MDGWAVAGDGPWRVVGRVLAGGPTAAPLAPGEAVAIATGATPPAGARGVIRSERGSLDREGLLDGECVDGQDLRPAGEEAAYGDVLLDAGMRLTPGHLGLAAAAGTDELEVVRRPTARILVLGDELLTAGLAREGRIRDSLGPQLPAWLDRLGVRVTRCRARRRLARGARGGPGRVHRRRRRHHHGRHGRRPGRPRARRAGEDGGAAPRRLRRRPPGSPHAVRALGRAAVAGRAAGQPAGRGRGPAHARLPAGRLPARRPARGAAGGDAADRRAGTPGRDPARPRACSTARRPPRWTTAGRRCCAGSCTRTASPSSLPVAPAVVSRCGGSRCPDRRGSRRGCRDLSGA